MDTLNIALLQIAPGPTLEENLEKGLAACKKAKDLGADIALFPEMWSCGYQIYGRPVEEWTARTIPAGGGFVRAFQSLAGELSMAIALTLLEEHQGGPAIPCSSSTASAHCGFPTPRCTPATSMWSAISPPGTASMWRSWTPPQAR